MKKVFRALLVFGVLGIAVAGVSVLIRKNTENSSIAYSGGGGTPSVDPDSNAEKIYTTTKEIIF